MTIQDTDGLAALLAAREAAGLDMLPLWARSAPHLLLDRGLTPATYAACARWGTHAASVNAGIAEVLPSPTADLILDAEQATDRLVAAIELACFDGPNAAAATGWAAVLAGWADPETVTGLWTAIEDWGTGTNLPGGHTPALWSHRVGPLAPLAWAAGLTLAEATAGHGALRADDLLAAAALRGCLIPAGAFDDYR